MYEFGKQKYGKMETQIPTGISHPGQNAHNAASETTVGNSGATELEDVRKHFRGLGSKANARLDLQTKPINMITNSQIWRPSHTSADILLHHTHGTLSSCLASTAIPRACKWAVRFGDGIAWRVLV